MLFICMLLCRSSAILQHIETQNIAGAFKNTAGFGYFRTIAEWVMCHRVT